MRSIRRILQTRGSDGSGFFKSDQYHYEYEWGQYTRDCFSGGAAEVYQCNIGIVTPSGFYESAVQFFYF